MGEYTVVWKIEVDAENPQEAAMKALEIMSDPDSTATHFEVTDRSTGVSTTVDFEEEEGECEREWDDSDKDPGWWCLHDVTSCIWNNGSNTCMHEGNSLNPLGEMPVHFPELPEEGQQVLIDSPNGKTVAYWIWANEGDAENPKPDYRQWYALIDEGSPMDQPPTSWEPIP